MAKTWKQIEEQISECRLCPRLVEWREEKAREKKRAYQSESYWGKPVVGFGDYQAKVLVVGLAPGAHGSNRTGRMFTGDSSGDFLYSTLNRYGFASQAVSRSRGDGLVLKDIFITAVCRCASPGNRPLPEEITNCQHFIIDELELLKQTLVGIVTLGRIAYDRILGIYRMNGEVLPRMEFQHGVFYTLGEALPWLVCSYHPSRQNTQTGRLTVDMFDGVWKKVRELL